MDRPSPHGGDGSHVLADVGLASLSGLILVVSFPRVDLNWLAWGALVPLLLAVERRPPRGAYLLANITGLVFFVGIFEWMWQVPAYNLLDEAALGLYLAQFFALWGLGLRWLRRRTGFPTALIAPPLWVSLEYLRSHAGFLSLPWMLLGHSQYQSPALLQVTSVTGVYGLSFLIVLVNVGVADAIRRARRGARTVPASLATAGALLAVTALYGSLVLSTATAGERVTVAGVQGNVPQSVKWDRTYREATLQRYGALTRQAARERPALIVWPETAVPGDIQHDEALSRAVGQVAAEAGTHLLVGSSEQAKFSRKEHGSRRFNSMVLLTPEGRVGGVYRKIRLVPFGEYEPLQGIVAWPAVIASTMGNSVAGDQPTLFTIGTVSVASTICWENIFPELVRDFVRHGARLIVNATNEAWFQESGAPYQFLAISVFRAAENRVAVLRVANTGISALIDPYGRITQRLRAGDGRELFIEGILVADMPVSRVTTFYTAYGDVFAFAQLAACGLLILLAILPRADPGHPVA